MPPKKKTPYPVPKELRKEDYWKELNKVIDPELGFGIVDVGLVYDVEIDKDQNALIKMTFTSPACPVGPMLMMQAEDALLRVDGIKKAHVEIVWDPVWTPDRIDEEIKEMLMGL